MTKTLVATPDPEPRKPQPRMAVTIAMTGTTATYPASWTLTQVASAITGVKP